MNQILLWLKGGDIRSDGLSNETAEFILENPQLLNELLDGLKSTNDIVRGRTADALEKVARVTPQLLPNQLPILVEIVKTDQVPMVMMHVAMMLGHMVVCGEKIDEITSTLLGLLDDESAFTKSWAIVSLCIIGRKYPSKTRTIFERIAGYQADRSVAVRTRVGKAMEVLANPTVRFPKGWIKSQHMQDL